MREKKSANPQRIAIEVSGQKFLETAPEGFPPELFAHLADFWERGYKAASNPQQGGEPAERVLDLSEHVESRGRPLDFESEREGREAAKLRATGMTFGQIARRVCRYQDEPRHRCNKACRDRIRQAMEQYECRRELETLAKGELGS